MNLTTSPTIGFHAATRRLFRRHQLGVTCAQHENHKTARVRILDTYLQDTLSQNVPRPVESPTRLTLPIVHNGSSRP